ncbi:hypothetical protein [Arcanobacterium buesumense]|uniref:Uncharacterized protein n=1 Tax=Arcanobacterium buesumense TaxID=2722751 RepID=A0A6H2ELS7_9ACTO|nr:hypothetical protein [Arcanobacterium buesumense]QJC22026.1 hypothetical protein HC352_05595 [Arcanobacterium buesumense]
MITLLILTNLATATIAAVYYVRYNIAADDLYTAYKVIIKNQNKIAAIGRELDKDLTKTIEGENK